MFPFSSHPNEQTNKQTNKQRIGTRTGSRRWRTTRRRRCSACTGSGSSASSSRRSDGRPRRSSARCVSELIAFLVCSSVSIARGHGCRLSAPTSRVRCYCSLIVWYSRAPTSTRLNRFLCCSIDPFIDRSKRPTATRSGGSCGGSRRTTAGGTRGGT